MASQMIFTIFDSKAESYLPPFLFPKPDMARRAFADCVNSKEHQFGQHPDDYTLFATGVWDEDKGTFTPYDHKQSLGNGLEYVQKDRQNNLEFDLEEKSDGTYEGNPEEQH